MSFVKSMEVADGGEKPLSNYEMIEEEVEQLIKNPPPEGLINAIKEKHADEEPKGLSPKMQVLVTLLILFSALSGSLLGGIFSSIEADSDLVEWIALPGDLFIRALKAIVLPLVFVNIIMSVIQMAEAGKAGTIGKYTLLMYLLTTLTAATEGVIVVLMFKNTFSVKEVEDPATFVKFVCPQGSDFVMVQDGRQMHCVNETLLSDDAPQTKFEIDNLNDYFLIKSPELEAVSFSKSLQDGLFRSVVPRNLVQEFANFGFLGIVSFGVMFGLASQKLARKPVLIVNFLQDINDILIKIIEVIIFITPVAVFSLIVGALGKQEDMAKTFQDLGKLVAALIFADFCHFFVVMPSYFYLFVGKSPWGYMKHLMPAQIFAFSVSSSAATLPVTLKCVKASGEVPDAVRDFVLPIGATVNMDGAALYFPLALVFLANSAGLESGFSEYILMIIVATVGSAGAAPIPNAGLVLLLTAYQTVYGQAAPPTFGIFFAVEWLTDRMQTVMNVTGDAMVARIIAHFAQVEVQPDKPTSELPISEEQIRSNFEQMEKIVASRTSV